MKKAGFVVAALVLLSLGGCWINMHLTEKHTSNAKGPGFFASICAPEQNPTFNCDEVLKTRWSVFSFQTFSFVEPDSVTGAQPGTPIALLGWFYFTALAVWFAFVGRPSFDRWYWHLLPTFTVMAGCVVSAFFIYVLFSEMDVKCTWCLASHAINFLLLIGVLVLLPRKQLGKAPATPALATPPASGDEHDNAASAPDGTLPSAAESITPVKRERRGYPSVRLALVTIACALALIFAEYSLARADFMNHQNAAYRGQLAEIAKDTNGLVARYWAHEHFDIKLRADDPIRNRGPLKLMMVVFSDFQCPACRVFNKELEDRIAPIFGDILEIAWKHYPLSKECNPYSAINLHPQACEAACASEAARLQGGTDAFWKAHDYLFEHQDMFKGKVNWHDVAAALNLDPDRFLADMRSDDVKKRVHEDIELGKSLGVIGTPSVYIAGRKVDRWMLDNQQFLEKVKEAAERSMMNTRAGRMRARQRAEAARRRVASQPAATQGTPGRSDAP